MSAALPSAASLRTSRGARLIEVLRDMLSRPSGAVGLFLVVLHLLVAIFSPLLVPYDFKAISANDAAGAKAGLNETVSLIDKMAKKGVIHDNAASRYKSRIAKRLNGLAAA